jgi:hypothetical protein
MWVNMCGCELRRQRQEAHRHRLSRSSLASDTSAGRGLYYRATSGDCFARDINHWSNRFQEFTLAHAYYERQEAPMEVDSGLPAVSLK